MTAHPCWISAFALTFAACVHGEIKTESPIVEPPVSRMLVGFAAEAGELPEGVAIKGDVAYVGLAPLGKIVRVDLLTGETAPFASLPTPVPSKGFMTGLTFGPDGALYAGLVSFDPSVQAGIYRVDEHGGPATLFAQHAQMAFPNGLHFDARGGLFVSDSAAGTIFQVARDGRATAWAAGELLAGDPSACGGSGNPFPIGANGIAERDGALYVTNTDKGSLVRIDIAADGSAAEARLAVAPDCAVLAGADGLTTDATGDFIVAVNQQNKVVRITRRGEVRDVLTGSPADFPASVAWHGTTLVVTNFAFASAMSGQLANPGLLAIDEAE